MARPDGLHWTLPYGNSARTGRHATSTCSAGPNMISFLVPLDPFTAQHFLSSFNLILLIQISHVASPSPSSSTPSPPSALAIPCLLPPSRTSRLHRRRHSLCRRASGSSRHRHTGLTMPVTPARHDDACLVSCLGRGAGTQLILTMSCRIVPCRDRVSVVSCSVVRPIWPSILLHHHSLYFATMLSSSSSPMLPTVWLASSHIANTGHI